MNLHPLSSKYVWLAPSPALARDLEAGGPALLFYDGEKGEWEGARRARGRGEDEEQFLGKEKLRPGSFPMFCKIS